MTECRDGLSRCQPTTILLSFGQLQAAAHANADGLSRLPLDIRHPASTDSIFTIGQIQALPVITEQIATATRKDVVLSRVLDFVRERWPEEVSKELEPYTRCKHELSTVANCLLWGIRVVIPKKYQAQLLEELHGEHQGVSHESPSP